MGKGWSTGIRSVHSSRGSKTGRHHYDPALLLLSKEFLFLPDTHFLLYDPEPLERSL